MTPDRLNDYAAELMALHEQMLERDAVFADCENELLRRDSALDAVRRELEEAGAHIEKLTAEIEAMKATRVWKLGERYWRLRDQAKTFVGWGR
jgi:chromosome segregation ATPase